MSSIAERFQITIPPKKDESENQWCTPKSARIGAQHALDPNSDVSFSPMPKTQLHGKYEFANATGGEHDPSGIKDSSVYHPSKGFTRREMKATDDQYDGEHIDLFYGEAKDELGHVGFVERNNYLDRM